MLDLAAELREPVALGCAPPLSKLALLLLAARSK